MALVAGFITVSAIGASAAEPTRRILFIAGPSSHERGAHEFPAGGALLVEALNRSGLPLSAELSLGWPAADAALAAADLIVLYSDGLEQHVAKGRAERLRRHLDAGKSLAVLHFALEPPPDDPALGQLLLDAIGGRFEAGWSVNPIWTLQAPVDAAHPASRGLGELKVEDEWYFHLRFREDRRGLRPLLTPLPPADALGDDGPRSGNPAVRAALARGERQWVAWTCENANGARGFGFTGGHFHRHWYHEPVRKLVLNALAWTAGLTVPENGVASPEPTVPLYNTIDEAIARGDATDVSRHLTTSPDSLQGGEAGRLTPLQQAILRRRTEIALLLIERGADLQKPDSTQRTPLHLAVERSDPRLVEALLQRGADPRRRDQIGWTPLHHAAAKNQVAIARLLLDAGTDPNILSERGGTPLHEAATSGGVELVQLLLSRGTNPSIVSKTGVTALDLAREYQNTAIIPLLENR